MKCTRQHGNTLLEYYNPCIHAKKSTPDVAFHVRALVQIEVDVYLRCSPNHFWEEIVRARSTEIEDLDLL